MKSILLLQGGTKYTETAETDALTGRMTPTHFSVLRQEKKWRNVKKVLMMVIPIVRPESR